MIIDLIFLFIVAYEFKQLKLTITKITIIEIIIFSICLINPYARVSMLFLSLNSLQIFLPYIVMKKISLSKYIFLTGSYLNIIYCLTYPVLILIELKMRIKP
jgi:hypothetical protein